MNARASQDAWVISDPVLVSRERAAQFAASVDETREGILDGTVLAPTFVITLAWDVQNRVLNDVLPDGLGLHGEQAFRFHAPIEAGMLVHSRARLDSIVPRKSGTTATVRTETWEGERLLCTQLFTVFAVGQSLSARGAPSALAPSPSGGEASQLDQLARRIEVLPADQPQRYAAASGDTYRIHVDEAYARSMGLPGTIAHGMSTLAYAARAVQEAVGVTHRLTYLAARFSASVTPGATLTTDVQASVARDGDRVDGTFGTTADHVTRVISHGQFVAQADGSGHHRATSSDITPQRRTS